MRRLTPVSRASSAGPGRSGMRRARASPLPEPAGTMPSAAAVPISPRATSFAVPSPPTDSTSVSTRRCGRACELRGVSGPLGDGEVEVVPAGMAALGGPARLVARDARPRVQDRADLHAASRITRERLLDHAVGREALEIETSPRGAPVGPPPFVAQDLGERPSERLGIARGHQPSRDSVRHRLGDPARGGGHDRKAVRHRVEQARPESLEVRRQAEDRERRQQAIEVAAEACEHHAVGEAQGLRLRLER